MNLLMCLFLVFLLLLNECSSKVKHLKSLTLPKYKFRKILVENTTIIAQVIIKPRIQILGALHKKKN